MATLSPLEPLLDAKAVAAILGVHPQTVIRLARAGRFPALRYARHWRFRRADISAWIAEQAYVPVPPGPRG